MNDQLLTENLTAYLMASLQYDLDTLKEEVDETKKGNILANMINTVNRLDRCLRQAQTVVATTPGGKTLTREELATYNGQNGQPAYVAANGIVYEVSAIPAWKGATHFGQFAGTDVSGGLACHIGQPVLNKLKVVGTLI